jgi:cystathionine gamma-synthase/methionine-gamma-lyase
MTMADRQTWQLATRVVHAGRPSSSDDFTPTVTPIHPSVTYHYPSLETLDQVFEGTRAGYVYARYGNPTVTAFEEAVAALEEAEAALAFASGMAAIHATLLAVGVRSGASVVAAQDLYGATRSLLTELMRSQGVTVSFVNANDLEAVEAACTDIEPVALLVETISNPLLKVANIPALADIAAVSDIALLVDSTFTTPALMRPLSQGADVVIHSATKYLAGHGDVLGGVIATSAEVRTNALEILKLTGANLGPQEAWLALRGMRTLTLRMRQHCENAWTVARWLKGHPRVTAVHYPGLPCHPQHELAGALLQEGWYGGMVSFEIKGAGRREVFRFFEALRLCVPGTTLGDVHSLLLYPAHASHRTLSPEERDRVGIGEGLVRLSVGIEAADDIVADLEQALAALG